MDKFLAKKMLEKSNSLKPQDRPRYIYAHVIIEGFGKGIFLVDDYDDDLITLAGVDQSTFADYPDVHRGEGRLFCPLECVQAVFYADFHGRVLPCPQYPEEKGQSE